MRKSRLKRYLKERKMASVTIKTKHAPWVSYKTFSSYEGALGVTSRKSANVPTDAYTIPDAMNNLEFRGSASASAAMSCIAHCYGARWKNSIKKTFDDISLIGSIVLTSGDQLSTGNSYYIDTAVLTDKWITEVHVADGNAGNGMTRVAFDTSGYDVFFIKLEGSDVTDWIFDVSGW